MIIITGKYRLEIQPGLLISELSEMLNPRPSTFEGNVKSHIFAKKTSIFK